MRLGRVFRSPQIRMLTLTAGAFAVVALQASAQELPRQKQTPSRPATANGSADAQVCRFLDSNGLYANSSALKTLNAERMLGRICNPNYRDVCTKDDVPVSALYKKGISKDDPTLNQLLGDTWTLWASTVDIDNDGHDEIRIFRTVGTAYCTENYFFKRDPSGVYHLLYDEDTAGLDSDFCGTNLSFLRYRGRVFALESSKTIETVWRGSDAGADRICDFSKRTRVPLKLTFDSALPKEDAVDLNAKWHFISIGDWYSDGKDNLLCVQTATEKYAFWNPRTDTLSAPLDRKCEPGRGRRLIEPTDSGPVKLSFSGIATGRCSEMFNSYSSVSFPDGDEGSFYVIKRLKEPELSNQYRCIPPRDGKKFWQVFSQIDAALVNVGDNKLLLYADVEAMSGMCSACISTFAQPTLLLLRAVPKTVWSSNQDVFIVPKQVLDDAVADQSDDVLSQYQAVMKVIGNQVAVQPAP